MAQAQQQAVFQFCEQGDAVQSELPKKLVEDFRIDGLVMQMSRTCKLFIPDQIAIVKAVQESTGLPRVVIAGDMVDDRLFSEAKVENLIETFIEGMARSKG